MRDGVTKKQLIESLSETLSLTRAGVDHLELLDEDTVVIHYIGGASRKVNIAMNSAMAIIRDVAKYVD